MLDGISLIAWRMNVQARRGDLAAGKLHEYAEDAILSDLDDRTVMPERLWAVYSAAVSPGGSRVVVFLGARVLVW
jgi:hypothetical protein